MRNVSANRCVSARDWSSRQRLFKALIMAYPAEVPGPVEAQDESSDSAPEQPAAGVPAKQKKGRKGTVAALPAKENNATKKRTAKKAKIAKV